MQRVGGVGVANLGLHHHQGDAVDEQDNVRDDAALHTARCIDAELVDGVESVAAGIAEIDQLHHRVGLTGDLVAVDLGLEQQGLHHLVALQQGAARLAHDLIVQVAQLAVGQPGAAVRIAVDRPHRLAKHPRQQPLAKVFAQAFGRFRGDAPLTLVEHLPAQRLQLVEKGFFDVEVFRHGRISLAGVIWF